MTEFFFFKQKTAYEMRISDWSSDVCSSDLAAIAVLTLAGPAHADTLIDNVNGITLDQDGQLIRFTGLVIDTQGKVKTLLSRKDKRPERPDFKQDAKGKTDRKSTRLNSSH